MNYGQSSKTIYDRISRVWMVKSVASRRRADVNIIKSSPKKLQETVLKHHTQRKWIVLSSVCQKLWNVGFQFQSYELDWFIPHLHLH